MNTATVANTMSALFGELVHGSSPSGGYMLNPGDEGLLRALDRLPASSASAVSTTGSSIAAHVDHIRYGLSLMNRWSGGENPFEDAKWSVSWTRTAVSDQEWTALRAQLRAEATKWLETLRAPREVTDIELTGMFGSIAHLAYHLGAIRQIDEVARGPAAAD